MFRWKPEISMWKLFHRLYGMGYNWHSLLQTNACTSASKGKCNWIGMLAWSSHSPLACTFVFLLKLNDLITNSVILGLAKYAFLLTLTAVLPLANGGLPREGPGRPCSKPT